MSTKLVAEFLSRAQRSGLLTKERLSGLREQFSEQGISEDDPVAMADAMVASEAITRWQADKLLQGKHKGFFLGSYRLLRPLGKGGMGAVFLAEHEMMRRRCAIKILPHSQIKEGSSVLKRFYVEAQAVAALDHQNIVRAYDVSKEVKDGKDIHYLVMEYVDGADIQNIVQEHGVMDCIRAADYLRQTANGLAHAHDAGLVHRDIKPANLLVDTRGVVKILDLGLARFFDDSDQASLTTAHNETVLGTADYLSPEQALNSHDVDLRTDIYSLGCTAYFMLTGHPPFPEGSVAQRLIAHQVRQPEPITSERRDANPRLVALIEKMMAKKPEQRPQSASEVSQALAAWLLEHGGEDWRRQHSELSGDSGLFSLLTPREPTRAMSSPSSETKHDYDLSLVDDDEEDQHEEQGKQPAPEKPAPAKVVEPELEMAEDEQDPHPLPDLEELESLERPAAAGLFGELGEGGGLPSLDEPDPLATLDEAQLLDAIPPDDPLANLDNLAAAESSGSLNALDSAVKSIPGSLSGSQRVVKAEPPQGTMAGVTSVGLPIIIGVGGGLILVLVLLLIILRSPHSPTGPIPDPEAIAQAQADDDDDGATVQPADVQPADVQPADVQPADDQSQHGDSDKGKQAGSGKKGRGSQDGSQKVANSRPHGTDRPQTDAQSGTSHPTTVSDDATGQPAAAAVDQTANDSGRTGRNADNVNPDAGSNRPDEEPATDNATSGQPAGPKKPPKDTVKPKPEEPVPPAVAPLTDQDKQDLLSHLKEIQLKLDFPSRDDRFPSAIMRLMEETAQDLNWSVTEQSSAVMHVVVQTTNEAEYTVLQMAMSVRYSDATQQDVELWKTEEPTELMRFITRRPLTGLAMNAALNHCRGEASKTLSKFARELRRD